jgi:hypothetical protein
MDTLNKILKLLKPDIQPQTISVYPRHSADCKKPGDQNCKRKCPKWLYVFQDGKDFRLSARTRSWEKAEELKREIGDSLDPVKSQLRQMKKEQAATRVTISEAVTIYLSDAAARSLGPETIKKLKGVFKTQLVSWAERKALVLLDELTTLQLTQWRST